LLLLKLRSADYLPDEERPRMLLCADVVKATEATSTRLGPVEYVTVHWWELRGDYVPSGPLDLTKHPDEGGPALTVCDYGIGYVFDGPVFFMMSVYGAAFDVSSLVGIVYAAQGRDGVRPFEPFADRPVSRFSEHACRLSLEQLGLSTSLIRCLESDGMTTALDLCVRTAADLQDFPHLGKKQLQEVRDRLAAAGLWLYDEKPS
jgi:hypothetical protein